MSMQSNKFFPLPLVRRCYKTCLKRLAFPHLNFRATEISLNMHVTLFQVTERISTASTFKVQLTI